MKDEIIKMWNEGSDGYNKYAKKSLSIRSETISWQQLFSEKIGKENQKILDVGTGPGIIAIQLAELGHDVTGVDLSEEMLKNAEKNSRNAGLKIEFKKGDAEELPFEDNTFDIVVSRFVLWNLPNPEKALREWSRVLKKGGKIIYVDIDDNEHPRSYRPIKWRIWHRISQVLILLTEHSNPFKRRHRDGKIYENLWSTESIRPKTDIEMLNRIGLVNISVTEKLKQKTLKGVQYLKYGYMNDYFIICATKIE